MVCDSVSQNRMKVSNVIAVFRPTLVSRSTLLSTLPGGAPSDEALLRPVFDAWVNYLAMCAGVGAPGTGPLTLYEHGYQQPVDLVTVRLRGMVEVSGTVVVARGP